jgi:hypothetical protein
MLVTDLHDGEHGGVPEGGLPAGGGPRGVDDPPLDGDPHEVAVGDVVIELQQRLLVGRQAGLPLGGRLLSDALAGGGRGQHEPVAGKLTARCDVASEDVLWVGDPAASMRSRLQARSDPLPISRARCIL